MTIRRRFVRSLALPLTAAALLAACGEDPEDVAPTTTTAAPGEVVVPDAPEPQLAGPQLEILEHGAEPRTDLRLQLEPGTTSTGTMQFVMGFQVEQPGEEPVEQPSPVVRSDMAVTVVEAAGDEYQVEITYGPVAVEEPEGAPPGMYDALGEQLAALEETTGTARINDRGAAVEGSFALPEGLDPDTAAQLEAMSSQIEQLTPPLPPEPVGVGAKWKVTQELSFAGIVTTQSTNYTLTALDGDDYTLELTILQSADPQQLEQPGALPTDQLQIQQLQVMAEGTLQSSLRHLVPTEATSQTAGEMAFSYVRTDVDGNQQEGELTQRFLNEMQVRRND
jgi:hypothetical protein